MFDALVYSDANAFVAKHPKSFVAVVPRGITDALELLKVLQRELFLPTYFGQNWNALDECLRDLNWMEDREVTIIHEDMPNLLLCDQIAYVEVLDYCVLDWNQRDEHKLFAVFPDDKETRARIQRLADAKP